MAITDLNNTDQTTAQIAVTTTPTKTWRPIRPVASPVINDTNTANRLQQLQGKINDLQTAVDTLDNSVTQSPAIQAGAPSQVSGVSASVESATVGGTVMSVVTVNFTLRENDTSAQIWFTGYSGNASPQLMSAGSPGIQILAQTTNELVTITVVGLNSASVSAPFAGAPTTTVRLSSTASAPPAPTISQALVATTSPVGWQFAFNIISGLLSNVITKYNIYRSATHTTPSPGTTPYTSISQPSTTTPYTFQDAVSGTFYYWVSSVDTTGAESVLTDASAVSQTTIIAPTSSSGSTVSNPTFAYDGNLSTAAVATLASHGSGVSASTTWSGFAALPTGVTIDSVTLEVNVYAAISGHGSASLALTATGVSGTMFSITSSSYASEPQQWLNYTLPNTVNLTTLQVTISETASPYTAGSPPHLFTADSTVTVDVYEIRVVVAYH